MRKRAVSPADEVPPERLWRFRLGEWLTREQMADVVESNTGWRQPRLWYQAWRTYSAERAEWARRHGITVAEMTRRTPAPVAVDQEKP